MRDGVGMIKAGRGPRRCILLVLAQLVACGDHDASVITDAALQGDGSSSDTSPAPDAIMPLVPQAYVKAAIPYENDCFGGAYGESTSASIALSADGSTMAVSALMEASNAVGINGTGTNRIAQQSGAVWVYVRTGVNWAQQAYLKASDAQMYARFGTSVALSADGSTLAVGAGRAQSGAGRVYVFSRTAGTWTQQAIVSATNAEPNDGFGWSTSLSGDGSMLAVGAVGEASGIVADDTDNSADGAGAVYVFTRAGSVWTQQAYLKASNPNARDLFGWGLALSSDGSTLAASAYLEDSASTDPANNAAEDAGAVYVFTRTGSVWSSPSYIKASNVDAHDRLGSQLALAADGSTLAVSAEGESSAAVGINGDQADNSIELAGAVYVFTRSGSAWNQQAYIKERNPLGSPQGFGDGFGRDIALSADGSRLAVGAHTDDSSSSTSPSNAQAPTSGAVYLFDRSASTWTRTRYVKASNIGLFDSFGDQVALSSDASTLAVSAPYEDSAASGVNGNQADNSLTDSGACYVFTP